MKKMKWIIFGVTFLFAQNLLASNLSFLNASAVSNFQGRDGDMMSDNAINALNHYPDGKQASWSNPATGAHGYAIPSRTSRKNGLLCRNLKIFNEANLVTGQAEYRLCKYNQDWKIVFNQSKLKPHHRLS